MHSFRGSCRTKGRGSQETLGLSGLPNRQEPAARGAEPVAGHGDDLLGLVRVAPLLPICVKARPVRQAPASRLLLAFRCLCKGLNALLMVARGHCRRRGTLGCWLPHQLLGYLHPHPKQAPA